MQTIRWTIPAAVAAVLGSGGLLGVAAAHPTTSSRAADARPATNRAAVARTDASSAPHNPSANTSASAAFMADCNTEPVLASKCDAPALASFDVARAKEGLAPMTLPTDFDTLSTPTQLFVLANIDRVDHGLAPVTGMNTSLNKLANGSGNYGVQGDNDPQFPSPYPGSDRGGGNWAGVDSSLLAEFLWMYDDGVGSANEDCTKKDSAGCWGHRDNIMWKYSSRLLMGAAATDQSAAGGQSSAEEFIGGDSQKPDSVTWKSYESKFPVGVSPTSVSIPVTGGQAQVVSWASGLAMKVTGSVTGAGWSIVGSRSCDLAAGAECGMTVAYTPTVGTGHGTLTVTGPNGPESVALSVVGTPPISVPTPSPTPTATMSPSPEPTASSTPSPAPAAPVEGHVRSNHKVVHGSEYATLTGALTSTDGRPVTGHDVDLQRRTAGNSTWHNLSASRTDSKGDVAFRVRPTSSASYRLASVADSTWQGMTSKSVPVAVKPIISISLAHHRLHSGKVERIRTHVRPGGRHTLRLLARSGHHWVAIASGRTGSSGRCTFAILMRGHGTEAFKVVAAKTRTSESAVSHVFHLHLV